MSAYRPYTPARTGLEAKRWLALARSGHASQLWVEDTRAIEELDAVLGALRGVQNVHRATLVELRDRISREAQFLLAYVQGHVQIERIIGAPAEHPITVEPLPE